MTRAEILDKAKECACGKREQDHGSPESNFGLIADLWTDYIRGGRTENELFQIDSVNPDALTITPKDVAMMMSLLKIARIKNGGGSGDSFVDLAGYAACGGEIHSSRID
ncbi:MAG: hypothetical protein IJ716_14575 [Lachnospiraceae bacterium]|nr:hypothetical protein [Lachnospiraceae bacterium]